MIAQKSCTLAPLNLAFPVDINSMELPLLIEIPMYPAPTPPAPTGLIERLWYRLGSFYNCLSSCVLGQTVQESAFERGLENRAPNPDFFWPALPPCTCDDGCDSSGNRIARCVSSSKRKDMGGNDGEDPKRRVSKRPRLYANVDINKRKIIEDENLEYHSQRVTAKRQHLDGRLR